MSNEYIMLQISMVPVNLSGYNFPTIKDVRVIYISKVKDKKKVRKTRIRPYSVQNVSLDLFYPDNKYLCSFLMWHNLMEILQLALMSS